MLNKFMVGFSYTNNGERKYMRESVWAENAQKAVKKIRFWYDDFYAALRIENVWYSRNGRWEETEAWE